MFLAKPRWGRASGPSANQLLLCVPFYIALSNPCAAESLGLFTQSNTVSVTATKNSQVSITDSWLIKCILQHRKKKSCKINNVTGLRGDSVRRNQLKKSNNLLNLGLLVPEMYGCQGLIQEYSQLYSLAMCQQPKKYRILKVECVYLTKMQFVSGWTWRFCFQLDPTWCTYCGYRVHIEECCSSAWSKDLHQRGVWFLFCLL